MLRVELVQLKEGPLRIEGELDPNAQRLEGEGVRFKGRLKVRADLQLESSELIGAVTVSGSERITCSRCLEEIDKKFTKEFEISMDVAGKMEVDLARPILDEVFLDLPIKVLCKKDCKGLCPKCGTNLNKGKCKCRAYYRRG